MNKPLFYRLDWVVILCYLSLVFFGLINIFSSTYNTNKSQIVDLQINQNYNDRNLLPNEFSNEIDESIDKQINTQKVIQKNKEVNKQHNEIISFKQLIDINSLSGKHFIVFIVSIVFGFFILFIRTQFFQQLSYLIYFISILCLIGLFFFGKTINSATSWYIINGISIQPSELAKIGAVFALSRHLSDFNTDLKKIGSLIKGITLILVPSVLIILQPDPGSAIIFGALFLIFFREGLSFRYLIISIFGIILFISTLLFSFNYIIISIVCITLIIIFFVKKSYKKIKVSTFFIYMISSIIFVLSVNFIYNSIFEQRHRDRFNVILGVIEDTKGLGYNINQSKIAIGSGGLIGKGFLEGTQTKGNFVPEQQTDYIFTTVGEEWGFIGSFGLIIVFLILITRMLNQAEKQSNIYRRNFIYGISSLILSHFTINIGMSLGLVPTIGIPLPFISSGGSNLLAFSLMIFIYLNFDANRLNHW